MCKFLKLPASLVMSDPVDCICGYFWSWTGVEILGSLVITISLIAVIFLSIAESLIVLATQL